MEFWGKQFLYHMPGEDSYLHQIQWHKPEFSTVKKTIKHKPKRITGRIEWQKQNDIQLNIH